jgi:hypothetical protein
MGLMAEREGLGSLREVLWTNLWLPHLRFAPSNRGSHLLPLTAFSAAGP